MRALILAADGVEDCELLYPYYRLLEEGADVDIAGPERAPITGKHGYTVAANLSFAEVQADQTDLLILPGGKAPETVRLDDSAIEASKRMFASGKVIAAICHGAQVLISADVLKGKNATCWKGIRDDLKMAGANFADKQVVVDGNLISSRCPDDLPAFCREIFRALNS